MGTPVKTGPEFLRAVSELAAQQNWRADKRQALIGWYVERSYGLAPEASTERAAKMREVLRSIGVTLPDQPEIPDADPGLTGRLDLATSTEDIRVAPASSSSLDSEPARVRGELAS